MILADKITQLRKKYGWSQETLADKMNVSRQSVSKWESANAIPDLNKIIQLSEIFGVSTDYLLKDEIEEAEAISEDKEPGIIKVTLDQANQYINEKKSAAKLTAIGVFITVCCPLPLILLLGLSSLEDAPYSSDLATAIGLVTLLFMVALGVSLFIRSSHITQEHGALEEGDIDLVYGVKSIIKEKKDQLKPRYNFVVSTSVMMFILSAVPLLVTAILDQHEYIVMMMLALLFLIVGYGIFRLIPVSDEFNAYNRLLGEGDYAPSRQKANKRTEKFAGFYWPLVTAIYLGWSFWTMAWGTTWIVWPVAAVLFGALVGLISMFEKDDVRE